ncbi:MAG: hypothetical protein CL578_05730 [Alteromonadaceae bacterium]|uniref:Uncharacterized protein n=1 Tax=Paraglaciecola agarilytica NO2 TaxID=1125747 RepID=A0ABQ0I200_9ALTE|nr:hypothetical protein [Paraglaciecola agarilytica]MBN24532.1 hypothetical protein [Alteromonadaceae bacterium]GAC03338.1 hypothetical protein GAGA_0473 [Paraglaciecola agarilytica NO2]|tara:strand:- start:26140 stop:26529 length:390 start_codon:yes stop_codon:yes gene_type:complete
MKATLQKAQFATYKEANVMAEILDNQRIEHTSFVCGEFIVLCWAQLETAAEGIGFTLYDGHDAPKITGNIENHPEGGLSIHIDGRGLIVFIEQYQGDTCLLVYDDANRDTPSHKIKLSAICESASGAAA